MASQTSSVVSPETRWRLVESKCNELRAAVQAARIPFFLVLLWSFTWFCGLYNHEYGYVPVLIDRYEDALLEIESGTAPCKVLTDHWISRYHPTIVARYDEGTVDEHLCRAVLQEQHKELLSEQLQSWKLRLPAGIATMIVFDLGVLGQVALVLLLLWLYFSVRRENRTIRAFVDIEDELSRDRWFPANFTLVPQYSILSSEHYAYAYHAVCDRFMFLVWSKSGPLLLLTLVMMSLPLVVSSWNTITDVRDVVRFFSDVGPGGVVRATMASLLYLAVVFLTFGVIKRSTQTSVLLNAWYLGNHYCWEQAWNEDLLEAAPAVRINRRQQKAEMVRATSETNL